MSRAWFWTLLGTACFGGVVFGQEDRPAWTARLDDKMEFFVEREPLEQALERFESELGVDVVLDAPALDKLGVTTDTLVSFKKTTLSRRAILDHLLQPFELTFVVEPDALFVTSKEAAKGMQVTRLYDVRDLGLAIAEWGVRHSEAARDAGAKPDAPPAWAPTDLIALIFEHIRPDSWEESGGQSQVEVSGDVLVVTQSAAVHEEIEDLLKRLRTALATRPGVVFDAPPAWSARLDERTESPLSDPSLQDVLDFFESQLGVPILVDQPALKDMGLTLDVRVHFRPATMKRSALLRHLLGPLELAFVVEPEALVVTSRESANHNVVTRVIDVDSLVDAMLAPAPPSGNTCEALAILIRDHVERDSWDSSGGMGRITALAGALVVTQTPAGHERIGDFLKRYRAILEKRGAKKE